MTNLGNIELGDTIRIKTSLYNTSSDLEDASDIRMSILDSGNSKIINESNMSRIPEGIYQQDIYLNSNNFNTGLHYLYFSGYTTNQSRNVTFIDENIFYIEENRLL
jgi:hypothetical protein